MRPVVIDGAGLGRDLGGPAGLVQPGPPAGQLRRPVLGLAGQDVGPWPSHVRAAFGQPARVYYVGPYTILVWNKNLLADLPR